MSDQMTGFLSVEPLDEDRATIRGLSSGGEFGMTTESGCLARTITDMLRPLPRAASGRFDAFASWTDTGEHSWKHIS